MSDDHDFEIGKAFMVAVIISLSVLVIGLIGSLKAIIQQGCITPVSIGRGFSCHPLGGGVEKLAFKWSSKMSDDHAFDLGSAFWVAVIISTAVFLVGLYGAVGGVLFK